MAKGFMIAAALAAVALSAPASAQDRDPAYAAARSAGQVGELPTGYLGTVGAAPAPVARMVEDLNIKRKSVYAQHAKEQGVTIEAYAFTTGCNLIEKTSPGEKYMGTDGQWHTRGGDKPLRDARCPG
ncbi:YdbL family protein [Novosphingobium rosa]|uniref:YdbL family protein n=1 Tax=Novosphingobium rosa TaxID=76978 RepID=UPI000A431F2D|nr:YdbL family protein [Novosphingobium rosa]